MTTALGFLVLLALLTLVVAQLDRTARRSDTFAAPPGADLSHDHDLERVRADAAAARVAGRAASVTSLRLDERSRRAGHHVGRGSRHHLRPAA